MTPQPSPARILAATLAVAALSLPSFAAAERIITRKGEVIVGTPRFEQDVVVVVREDGSEVRIPRTQVERIELTEEEAAPETAPPASVPRSQAAPPPEEVPRPPARTGPPPWRPRTTPPPPSVPPPAYRPPYTPPPPPPVYRERAYDQNGFALTLGYHRGFALGGEYQVRTAKSFGLGVGAQIGLEPVESGDRYGDGSADAYGTFGFTGRAYVGRAHRLALELGFGLNAIDPELEPNCSFDERDCAERNYGPELSAGYQFVSDRGFLFETLIGFAVITNERYADAHAPLNPLFQLSFGYLFH